MTNILIQFVCFISCYQVTNMTSSPQIQILSCSSVKLILFQSTSKGLVINNSDSGVDTLDICKSDNRCLNWKQERTGGGIRKTAAFPKLYLKMLTPSAALQSHGSTRNIPTNNP